MGSAAISYEIEPPQAAKFEVVPPKPNAGLAPPAGGPNSQPMSRVRTLTGTPYNPGRIERGIVDQIGGAAQTAANVSAPVIGHRILQQTGAIGQGSRLYPEEGTLKDSARDATILMAGGAEGLDAGDLDAPAMDATPATETPRITTPKDPSNFGAKAKAVGKLAAQDAISRIPIAGRIVRRPSIMDYIDAARTKVPQPETVAPATILDATGENQPFAGGMDEYTPPPEKILDATGENKPFAGGMDEPSAVSPVPKKAPGKVGQPVSPAVPAGEVLQASPSFAAPPVAQKATPATTAPSAPNAILSPIEATQTPKGTLTNLKQQINDALGGKTKYEAAGGKPLEPGVSLKNQRPQTNLQQQIQDAAEPAAKQTPKAPQTNLQQQINNAANPLPEGFTATPESSALRGYKYDPDAQHFEVITNTGERFGRIGITPDQVEAFAKSESKGRAWPVLKNAPGAIPTKNGVPRTVQTSYRSASPDDVSPEWQKSVDYLKAKKASKPN